LENYEDNFELKQKAEEISGKIYGAKRE